MTDGVIDPRFDHLNRTTSKARNEAILLNIVRASKNIPLNFATFSKVSGSTTATGSASTPAFILGPMAVTQQVFDAAGKLTGTTSSFPVAGRDVTVTKDTLGGSMVANTVFDFSLLDTGNFYAGLLKPVNLANFNYFVRQGYSRELLFWLFVELVRETVMGRTVEFLNEPDQDSTCNTARGITLCFRDMIDVAVASGLTVETRVEPPKDPSKEKPKIYARLCFDRVLVDRVRRSYDREVFKFVLLTGHGPHCKTDPWPHQVAAAKADKGEKERSAQSNPEDTDTLTFNISGSPFGTLRYEVITRSTFGIYQFLGRILAANLQDDVTIRGPRTSNEDRRILGINHGSGDSGCFAETALEGEFFCVPRHGAENTKRIFSLLAALVALNTNVNDLAITPTVRLAQ